MKPRKSPGRTPDTERQAKCLANLRQAGGDTVKARLTAEALASLNKIMAQAGTNKSESICDALIERAKTMP